MYEPANTHVCSQKQGTKNRTIDRIILRIESDCDPSRWLQPDAVPGPYRSNQIPGIVARQLFG
jgi:hypothetical protein